MITLDSVKKQASLLKKFFEQKDVSITHSTCLLAVSKMHGFKDWNTLSASLKNQEKASKTAKKRKFIGDHVEISEPALLAIANKGVTGNLDENAIQVLSLLLAKAKK